MTFQDFKRSLSFTSALALSGILIVAAPQAIANVTTQTQLLAPSPEHGETLVALAKTLRFGHYKKRYLDDELSAELLDAYIAQLDRSRLYFMEQDLQEFEVFRSQLDDAIRKGDPAPAFVIHNRYQQRVTERLNYLLDQLDQGLEQLDFARDESMQIERKDSPWATSTEQLDQIWRQRLKSTVLNLKLADKSLEEARETLTKRYQTQLNRLQQNTAEDAFSIFANAYSGLYDPHTNYFSPRNSENFNINMRLSLEGIGAVLQSEDEHTKVVRLIAAGPADKQGQLKPADLVVGVGQGKDGEIVDVVGWRLDEVVDKIRGPKDSTVRLEILRKSAEGKSSRTINIVRNKVKLEEQAAQKKLIELERNGIVHKIGVISIPTFYIDFRALQAGDPNYRSTTRDVEKLLSELIKDGAEGLIIDLRNNGGGSLKESVDLSGLFIEQGPVVQIKDSIGRIRVESDYDPKFFDIPLMVMVNRLSASASEIFAGAIKDYNRGLIVGSPTFGKGTVQALHPLKHGQIKLTQQMFYRVSGSSTQNRGVHPHLELPELYDVELVGESTEDGALPWDQVKPQGHTNFNMVPASQLSVMAQQHQQRAANEPDLIAIREGISHRKEQKLENLPLNEQKLREVRAQNEELQLAIENRRRNAKALDPLGSLAELESEQAESTEGISIERDALLKESSEVMLDYLNIHTTAMQ
ncbi:MAG: carboxy terminal-processing peptidase [Motiliproteus sp.]